MAAKTLAEKLLIGSDAIVWSSDPSRLDLVGPLPEGARVTDALEGATTALVFAADAASLREILDAHGERLAVPAVLWVAYPKANRADINRDSVWPMLAEHGLRPIAQVSLGEVWSALRFRPLRAGEAQFTGGR